MSHPIEVLITSVENILVESPGLSTDSLSNLLQRRCNLNYHPLILETVLSQYIDRFARRGEKNENWYALRYVKAHGKKTVVKNVIQISQKLPIAEPSHTLREQHHSRFSPLSPSLWNWQHRALTAWEAKGHQGVVEAVTGTGKTNVGIAAAALCGSRGMKTLVLVPSIALLNQWYSSTLRSLPQTRIGRFGDGHRDDLHGCDILISTVQSCYSDRQCTSVSNGVLIADECHHYGSPEWERALKNVYPRRLGLTATYERSDHGVRDYLNPYFGGICYSLNYKEALADDIIANFKVAFLGVKFSCEEQVLYDQYDEQVRHCRNQLIWKYSIVAEPAGDFMREVSLLAKDEDEAGRIARWFLSAFTNRRKVLAEATGKIQRLSALEEAIKEATRTVVFTQTKDAAEKVVNSFQSRSISSGLLHSGLGKVDRLRVMADFERGDDTLLAAPKLLDEGIDVPDADLAIIVAASRSRLQMVQRFGRVLRKKKDGRLARVVVMYVIGTSEDPQQGAHEGFLELVKPVARQVHYFSPSRSKEEICSFLNDWKF